MASPARSSTRSLPCRVPMQMERETLPPPTQTILQTLHQIIRPRYKNIATITPSLTNTRPAPAPAFPMTPPPKEARKESPAPDRSIQYYSYHYDEEYPIHKKYDLQVALSNKFHGHDIAIIKAQRIPEEDVPAYFLHQTWKKDWLPGRSQQQVSWTWHCNHKGTKNPRRRCASLLFTPNLEEGLATHQGTNVKVPPWRILHKGGRASQIRKATEEYHIQGVPVATQGESTSLSE